MNVKETINFVAKTASNVYLLNYWQQASLKTLGQYLGRLVTRLPAAYTPFIAGVAINLLSDAVEKGLDLALKNSPKIKFTVQILVRVALGAGVFAAGTALTGGAGALTPALIASVKFGAFFLVADKVSKVAIFIFRCFSSLTLYVIGHCLGESARDKMFYLAEEFIPNEFWQFLNFSIASS